MKNDNFKAVLRYTKGFRLPIFLSFLLLGAELIISFVSPLLMSVTIDSVLGSKPLGTPWYFSWLIYAVGGVETIRRNIWIMAAVIFALQLILGLVRYIRAKCNNSAGEGVIKTLRDTLYAHIQRLPYAYHAGAQTGDIVQRATNDMETIRRFFTTMMLELVRTILMLLVGIFVMFSLNVPLTLITLVLVVPVALTSILFFDKISRLTNDQEQAEGRLFTVIQENLTGTRVVRAFGRQAFEMEKFDGKNEENRHRTMTVTRSFATLWATLDAICAVEIGAIMIVGILLCVNGRLTIGEFTAFTSYVFLFFWPIRGFGRALNHFSRTLVAAGRIEEVFSAKEEEDLDRGLTPDLSGDIRFENVCFAYDTVPVLKDLSMTIPGGATVAFLGGTGSGKSSVSLLLQRLYDIQSGVITIGGVDIRQVGKTYLRNRIGIVLQEPFLYSKSILQNIGIKCREPVPEEVRAAAVSASIHDDIISFEDGYDTVVGERGVTLSGGQKQRVAIARALMGESDVLIFDDSLSAVDTKTDAAIREALSARRRNVTTIIISHRITTLMEADKIFVLRDGHVIEEGSHEELMTTGGLYRRTYDIQNAVGEEGSEAS
ncbi:ATP-binding cassette, subfamily B [Sporobacter termitidis DSM 10068]|uniref:ATP-binding cassette, subfamily B n=1 Tax=Sporobacter termitidis DSM 10068 TaxID=1123282 RepID=A0A1M5TC83_9FIRM|nr:ABC transporter ATP-binding protein [Sporobacter termitidis]SHH48329.1 ATP-binding cassette, subfamily B [Sporobacter termitidis DSM 10068]